MKTEAPALLVPVTSTVADPKINPALKGEEYDEQPFIKEKVRRANEVLAKTGVPKL